MDTATNTIETESTSIAFFKALLYKLIYGGSIVFDLAKWLILVLVVFVIFNTFFFSIFIVSGASMDPTFKDGDWIAWNKNIYNNSNPVRGDIVVVNYPGDPNNKTYVKRIVGQPGDKIEIKNEHVFVNNLRLDEGYIAFSVGTDPNGVWTLNKNQYFVMGDNRPNSNDSRYFGPVEKRFILGKAISRLYPGFRLTKDM
ncbi:MAG: signal peptidase I [bacterium]|nr:signal peptidase I [bacterium]